MIAGLAKKKGPWQALKMGIRYLSSSLFLMVITLIGIGLVQVYSSSYIYAIEYKDNGLFFIQRQLFYSLIAVAGMLAVIHTPSRWIEKYGWLVWILASGMVAMTFIPGLGLKAGGAVRWLKLPFGMRFEPSELLKFSFVLFFASLLSRNSESLSKIKPGWLGLMIISPLLLLLKQPDFGSTFIIVLVGFGLLFLYGVPWRYFLSAIVVALPIFYYTVMTVPYRKARILAFLDPWADPQKSGFQAIQSMLSFNMGGFWGVGLGKGQGKLFFLPEAHTDFTIAVLGEEAGFIGFFLMLMLYGFLVFKGFQIASRSERMFNKMVSIGVSLVFAISVFVNMGVALGMLPTKGLTLPFLSYGGSSLVVYSLMFGLLINFEQQLEINRIEERLRRFKTTLK